MRTLCVIAARGGSKRLPGKNVMKLGRHPLIGHKILSTRGAACCTCLIVSTDDEEIAAVARAYGADVPFMRPAELASDTATSSDVVLHAMAWAEDTADAPYDAVMLLEPTSPFTRASDYDAAAALFERERASLVVGVTPAASPSLFQGLLAEDGRATDIVAKFADNNDYRGQVLEKEYALNGAFYLARWSHMKAAGKIYGDPRSTFAHVMDVFHSVNIDTEDDFRVAESFLDAGLVDEQERLEPTDPVRNEEQGAI